jgi:putative DNA primase/helicase
MLTTKPRTIDAAVGKWPGILVALGVDDKFLGKKHCSCPFCGGVDRFRFDDKNGSGSFICSQCGAGSGMDFVMRMLNSSFKDAAASVDRVVGNVEVSRRMDERSEADKLRAIKRVLSECRPVEQGDPVWLYLQRRTGIAKIPGDLKFHPGLFHSDGGAHPSMVSIMRDQAGRGVTVHRTYLTQAGEKASVDPVKKFMAGKKINGAAVRLSRVAECIGIAEGIETSLAASMRFQLPVWAATNATLLEQFMPPAGVTEVRIYGDNDSSFTGQAAAFALAKRLMRDGFKVSVEIPQQVDKDWCDDLG